MASEFKVIVWGAESINEDLLEKCAKLFSTNYGIWGEKGVKPGKPVTLSASRLKSQYLFNPRTCSVVTAMTYKSDELVGHAFVCRFPFLDGNKSFWSFSHRAGVAAWVTQLVVRKDMRSKGIATELFAKVWTKDNIAWGLVTSHPHAVRALERATGKVCVPQIMSKHAETLMKASEIPYIQNCKVTITGTQSIIHSNFFVDHKEVNEFLKNEENWRLGALEEGDEFFALVASR
jgi:GNAT superfamily N-acetyltransferase